jgi:hypothetical protein
MTNSCLALYAAPEGPNRSRRDAGQEVAAKDTRGRARLGSESEQTGNAQKFARYRYETFLARASFCMVLQYEG